MRKQYPLINRSTLYFLIQSIFYVLKNVYTSPMLRETYAKIMPTRTLLLYQNFYNNSTLL